MPEQSPAPNEAVVAQLRKDFEALMPLLRPELEPAVTYSLEGANDGP